MRTEAFAVRSLCPLFLNWQLHATIHTIKNHIMKQTQIIHLVAVIFVLYYNRLSNHFFYILAGLGFQ